MVKYCRRYKAPCKQPLPLTVIAIPVSDDNAEVLTESTVSPEWYDCYLEWLWKRAEGATYIEQYSEQYLPFGPPLGMLLPSPLLPQTCSFCTRNAQIDFGCFLELLEKGFGLVASFNSTETVAQWQLLGASGNSNKTWLLSGLYTLIRQQQSLRNNE